MNVKNGASLLVLGVAAFSAACTRSSTKPPGRGENVMAASVPAMGARVADATAHPLSAPPPETAQQTNKSATALEGIEQRKGPFTLADGLTQRSVVVVMRSVRLPGTKPDSQAALDAVDIVDEAGNVQYHEGFTHEVENGEFSDYCSAEVEPLVGSMGKGILLDVGCEPSAPLSGGPWEIIGALKGKIMVVGKPVTTEGQWGGFVPGAISHIGKLTQILNDQIRIRVFTGYFFVTVPVVIDWMNGKLDFAQHCFYQTGHGAAEGGCEMPVEDVERHPSDQDMTFVRMFTEPNEMGGGIPAHVVVKKESKVELLTARGRAVWEENGNFINLSIAGDMWVKVSIDGKVGWVHTEEDLNALGLWQSG